MHQALGPVHSAAEDSAKALVSETNPENRNFAGEVPDGVGGNTVVLDGFARSRGDHEMRRIERDQLVHRDLIVAEDPDIRTQLAKVLDKVVGEGVVIIDKD